MKPDWVDFLAIKQRVPITAVLNRYGINWLRKERGELSGRCPLHQGEGRRTFHVSLAKNVFHCFSCQAGGNVLDLIAALEKCTVREAGLRAQEWFAGAGAGGPAWTPNPTLAPDAGARNPPLGFELAGVDPTHPYILDRGILAQTARLFQIGVYLGSGMMHGRLVIPIHDERGRLVAYAGRAIDGAEPKYRFPAGFRKSLVLFNLHRALQTGSCRVTVVEGFFDCMRVHQAGASNVVALMGVALSLRQRELLVGNFEDIVLMLDGDDAGRRGSARIAELLANRVRVTVMAVPAGTQPDQLRPSEILDLLGTSIPAN